MAIGMRVPSDVGTLAIDKRLTLYLDAITRSGSPQDEPAIGTRTMFEDSASFVINASCMAPFFPVSTLIPLTLASAKLFKPGVVHTRQSTMTVRYSLSRFSAFRWLR